MKYTMRLVLDPSYVVAENIEADREPRCGDRIRMPGVDVCVYEVYRVTQEVGEDMRQRTIAEVIERMP